VAGETEAWGGREKPSRWSDDGRWRPLTERMEYLGDEAPLFSYMRNEKGGGSRWLSTPGR
jgi:hypothetical protein